MNRKRSHDAVAEPELEPDPGLRLRELMRAVLLDAVMCLRGRGGAPRDRERLAADARRWMMSTARNAPFSFESVCDVLGISSAYLRRLLLDVPASPNVAQPIEHTHPDSGETEALVDRLRVLRMRGNRMTRVVLTGTGQRKRS